jgi:putative acetyltransferase
VGIFYIWAMTPQHLFTLRQATLADLPELKQLYRDTIATVCTGEYNAEQLAVWASSSEKTRRWVDLINNQFVLVAQKDGMITGFSSLLDNNYLDFMYVHKDYQRQGIAALLLTTLEATAKQAGTTTLTSDISKTARPFFEKNGYIVIAEQVNVRQGLEIINYKMKKNLG